RDVGLGRTERRRIGRVPIRRIGSGVCVAEISTADSDDVGTGRQGIHADTVSGRKDSLVVEVYVTQCGIFVAGGHEDRDAFGNALLVYRVVGRIACGAVQRLAATVADADDGGRIGGVDQILRCDQEPVRRV